MGWDLHGCNPPGVHEKKSATFLTRLSTRKCTGGIWLPVEKWCGQAAGQGFSPATERGQAFDHRHAGTVRRPARVPPPGRTEQPVPVPAAGYHSPVRSNTGDEIGRIATAIDQLESDVRAVRGEAGEAELANRIAALWQMVSALDPELARRAQRYTAPPGGAPSA